MTQEFHILLARLMHALRRIKAQSGRTQVAGTGRGSADRCRTSQPSSLYRLRDPGRGPLYAVTGAIACVGLAGSALAAGGPYVVDDAEILERGRCEIEAWHTRGGRDDYSTTVAPACHLIPGVELGLGATFAREAGDRAESFGLEAKTIFVEPKDGGVGFGLAGGFEYGRQSNRVDGVFAFAPLSLDPVDGVRLNLNIGWEWEREERRHFATWGVGGDWAALPRFSVIGEVFGRHRGKVGAQFGVRPELIEDRLHVDLTYRLDPDETEKHWFTIGARLGF